jgi:hypothetical protein
LKARKIGPVEILKKINDNAYRLRLPNRVHTADIFNVKHLIPYHGDKCVEKKESVNSGTNSCQPGEDDAAHYGKSLQRPNRLIYRSNDLANFMECRSSELRPSESFQNQFLKSQNPRSREALGREISSYC